MLVAQKLDLNLVELTRWNCCGTVASLTTDDLMHHLASVRNLIRVEEMNQNGLLKDEHRLITFCSMCYNTLKRVNSIMKDQPEKLSTITHFMDKETNAYTGTTQVIHFLDILMEEQQLEKLRGQLTKNLNALPVAPYYGCLLLRPKEIAIDSP